MKKIKKVLSILLVMALATSLMSVSASAFLRSDPTVVYDASKNAFEFRNVAVYEHTGENAHEHEYVDLFPGELKNVMPGDSFTQQIKVKIENAASKHVRITLIAENPNADYKKLFGIVEEDITGDEAETVVLQRNAEQLPTLTATSAKNGAVLGSAMFGQPLELGMFYGSSDSEIILEFAIPLAAGNELRALTAEVDWVFKAEVWDTGGGGGGGGTEIPDEDPPLSNLPDEDPPLADLPDEEPPLAELPDEEPPLAVLPQTGLLQWPVLVMGLAGLLLIAVGILSEQKRKARNN